MDGRVEQLQQEISEASQRMAELQVELDYEQGKMVRGTIPHYLLIERAAHEVGQRVSRRVQQIHMDRLASAQPSHAKCPSCGSLCVLSPQKRSLTSIDGPVSLQELKGHCPACRRDFFPDAGTSGL